MKTCPICKATSFDDMEICFGCMHRFGEEALMSIIESEEVEVEEPREEGALGQDASAQLMAGCQEELPETHAVMTVPITGKGFNLVISVQPTEEYAMA